MKLVKYLILIIVLVLAGCVAYPRVHLRSGLKGRVLNAETNQPIAGLKLEQRLQENRTLAFSFGMGGGGGKVISKKITITDANGYFNFPSIVDTSIDKKMLLLEDINYSLSARIVPSQGFSGAKMFSHQNGQDILAKRKTKKHTTNGFK